MHAHFVSIRVSVGLEFGDAVLERGVSVGHERFRAFLAPMLNHMS